MAIVAVGIDLTKNVFAVDGVDESGKPALVPAGGIRPLDALAEFVGGTTDQNHDICGFALRHTLASHGCCSRGKPGGR